MQLTRVILFRLFDEILHGDPGARLIGIRKQHRELISPETYQQIGLAERGTHQGGHRFQSFVTLLMSEAIVNGFEMVQIQPAKG